MDADPFRNKAEKAGRKAALASQILQGLIGSEKFKMLLIIGFILVMAALAALYIYKHRRITRQYGWLLILAMMPVAWFVVMKNHSLQHIFFTWRDFLITVWCLILYIFLTLRKPKVL